MLKLLLLALSLLATPATARPPQASVNSLLAADRAYAAQSARLDPVAGITAMLDDEAIMPLPGKGIISGKRALAEAFLANPAFNEGHVTWTPVRAGISADGTQGFTFGFMTVGGGDPGKRNRKYLSYWVKRPGGWRVVAFRQNPRDPGDVSTALLPPALPGFTAAPVANPDVIAAHQTSIAAAEKAFSDRAQIVGLKQAFFEFGRDDAINMYSGVGFTTGRKAISEGFKEEGPSSIHWGTETSIAASSGDLGISIGTIRPNRPPKAGEPDGFPFFTVWKRDGPDAPWRYIAE